MTEREPEPERYQAPDFGCPVEDCGSVLSIKRHCGYRECDWLYCIDCDVAFSWEHGSTTAYVPKPGEDKSDVPPSWEH